MEEIKIYKNNVPKWISENSIFYKSTIENSFMITDNLIKNNDQIYSIDDFKQIVEIVNHWEIVPFPENLIDYIKENKNICIYTLFNLTKLISARELLKLIYTSDYKLEYEPYMYENDYCLYVKLIFYLNNEIIFQQQFINANGFGYYYIEKLIEAINNNTEYEFSDYLSRFENNDESLIQILDCKFENNVLTFKTELRGDYNDKHNFDRKNSEINITLNEYNKKNIIKSLQKIIFLIK